MPWLEAKWTLTSYPPRMKDDDAPEPDDQDAQEDEAAQDEQADQDVFPVAHVCLPPRGKSAFCRPASPWMNRCTRMSGWPRMSSGVPSAMAWPSKSTIRRLADLVRAGHVVGDHQAGGLQFPVAAQDEVVDGVGGNRVEARGGLVVEDELGVHGDGAGQADAFAHAAGEFLGQEVLAARHAHEGEFLADDAADLGLPATSCARAGQRPRSRRRSGSRTGPPPGRPCRTASGSGSSGVPSGPSGPSLRRRPGRGPA